jgi:hypothetical protein
MAIFCQVTFRILICISVSIYTCASPHGRLFRSLEWLTSLQKARQVTPHFRVSLKGLQPCSSYL